MHPWERHALRAVAAGTLGAAGLLVPFGWVLRDLVDGPPPVALTLEVVWRLGFAIWTLRSSFLANRAVSSARLGRAWPVRVGWFFGALDLVLAVVVPMALWSSYYAPFEGDTTTVYPR